MQAKRTKRRRVEPDEVARSQRPTPGLVDQRTLEIGAAQPLPAARLRSVTYHPFLYRKMVDSVDPEAQPGDLVAVFDRKGELFGHGLYNPRSEIVLRILSHEVEPPDVAFWRRRLQRAVELRRDLLRLDAVTDAYRLVHAEADGITGLVVDRYGDVLSAEAFSLGIFQRGQQLLHELAALCGTRHAILSVDTAMHGQEGFVAEPLRSGDVPDQVTISEYGTQFAVEFAGGHKTGFFCDQRETRRQFAALCAGRSVLDLCCYTGGFAVQAKRLGGASEVTGVDLDENAIRIARQNAKRNNVAVRFVHADVFGYMRDMIAGGRQFDAVVLDPPKLIRSRREITEGTRKHFDLNRLALQLVRPGGLLLTCSCSGLLDATEFLRLLYAAARQAVGRQVPESGHPAVGRTVQLLAQSGAAPDHPVAPNCPETEYLKAVWLRVL